MVLTLGLSYAFILSAYAQSNTTQIPPPPSTALWDGDAQAALSPGFFDHHEAVDVIAQDPSRPVLELTPWLARLHPGQPLVIETSSIVRGLSLSGPAQCTALSAHRYSIRRLSPHDDQGIKVQFQAAGTAYGQFPLARLHTQTLGPTGQDLSHGLFISLESDFASPRSPDNAPFEQAPTHIAAIGSEPPGDARGAAPERIFNEEVDAEFVPCLVDPPNQTRPAIKLPSPKIFRQCATFSLMLDPGHNPTGKNQGAYAADLRREVVFNEALTKEVIRLLKPYPNLQISQTRPWDENRRLGKRSRAANRAKVDLLLSLHHDSVGWHRRQEVLVGGQERSVCPQRQGFSLYINARDEVLDSSWRAAYRIGSGLLSDGRPVGRFFPWGDIDRGIYTGEGLKILNRTRRPAVLLEAGFVCNPEDLKAVSTVPGRRRLARIIARGLLGHIREQSCE